MPRTKPARLKPVHKSEVLRQPGHDDVLCLCTHDVGVHRVSYTEDTEEYWTAGCNERDCQCVKFVESNVESKGVSLYDAIE